MQTLEPSDPRVVGGCRLLARIGSGGMGRVYLGLSPGGEPRAVKTARAELAGDPAFRARFAHEVRSARAVRGRWTLPVLDSGTCDDAVRTPWMTTEYVPGPSLQDAAADPAGRLADPVALGALAVQLSLALDAVHGAGLVHRDLKPANVLLTGDGPRVIDFGIARAAEHTVLTHTGYAVGSPGYLPPEQIEQARADRGVSPAGDVFSLGAVLAYAACGRPPFGEADAATLLYRVVHEEPELGGVPEVLRPVVGACLAKDPERRPATGRLREWVAEALGEGGSGPPAPAEGVLPEAVLPEAVRRTIAEMTAELAEVRAAPLPAPVPTQLSAPPPGAGFGAPTGYGSPGPATATAGPAPGGAARPGYPGDGPDGHPGPGYGSAGYAEAREAGYGRLPGGSAGGPPTGTPPGGPAPVPPSRPRRRRTVLLSAAVAVAALGTAAGLVLPRLGGGGDDGGSDVPSGYLGGWHGRIGAKAATFTTPGSDWTKVVLTLRRGRIGDLVGTGSDSQRETGTGRRMGCRYALKLTEAGKRSLVLHTVSTRVLEGATAKPGEGCPGDVTVTVRLLGSGKLKYDESKAGMEGALAPGAFNHLTLTRDG